MALAGSPPTATTRADGHCIFRRAAICRNVAKPIAGILRGIVFGVPAMALQALLPVVVRETLHGSALLYGVMLGCFGVGAVGGALANAALRVRFMNEQIAVGAFLGFAASTVVVAFSNQAVLSGAALFLGGGCWVLALSMFNVTIQLLTPRWVVGRAIALYQTCTFGGMAAGSWMWGTIAQQSEPKWALLGAAGVLMVGAVIGLRLPLPEFGTLNLDPLNQFREPTLRLDLDYRSGPIMVIVDYIIDSANVPEFLSAMRQRRMIRIRDGAQQWVLLRDLENPEQWSESYHVATWGEYVRHNERQTHADAESSERLISLHRGPGGPRVRRMIERQTVPQHDNMRVKP